MLAFCSLAKGIIGAEMLFNADVLRDQKLHIGVFIFILFCRVIHFLPSMKYISELKCIIPCAIFIPSAAKPNYYIIPLKDLYLQTQLSTRALCLWVLNFP